MTTLHDTTRILVAGAALTLPLVVLATAVSGEDRDDRKVTSDVALSRDREAQADTGRDEKRALKKLQHPPANRVVYRPPRTGSPTPDHRVGGGTRGGSALPLIAAIAPDHEGLTIRGQPELCWHLSTPDRERIIVFTLIEFDAIRPLVEQRLNAPAQPGLQRIRLSDYGVELEVGRRYNWSVSVVADPEHRSRDIVATGVIRRVAPPSRAVAEALSGSDPRHALRISAGAGLWYDAVVPLVDMIEAAPHDRGLRGEWASLLRQVRLSYPVLWSVEG